jgi:hypothetical protein
MFSPAYDQPQPVNRVGKWFQELGFEQVFAGYIQVATGKNALVKGQKPAANEPIPAPTASAEQLVTSE